MAIRTGLGAYVGAVAETSYGTPVTVTRFLEFLNEGIEPQIERISSSGIRAGSTVARTARWAVNDKGARGPISFEVANKGFGLWFKHAFGSVLIATPGGATTARTHTLVLGDKDDLSMTVQKVVPDVGGTNRAFTYGGCVLTEWELSLGLDGLLLFNTNVDAQNWTTATAAATASFPASDELFGYQDAAVNVDNGQINATGITLRCQDAMATERYYLRAVGTKSRPILNGNRTLGGELTLEFEDMTEVNYFLNGAPGTELEVELVMTGSQIESGFNYGLSVTMPKCRFDGGMVSVSGPDIITVSAPFMAMDDLSNEPVTAVYTTTDTAS